MRWLPLACVGLLACGRTQTLGPLPDTTITDGGRLASCGDGFVQPARGRATTATPSTTDACLHGLRAPRRCGDGFVQAGVEQCDDGNADNTDACTNALPARRRCGDGIVQAGVEQCDDGNADNGDGCLNALPARATCGDGFVHARRRAVRRRQHARTPTPA